jgi:hypothetical protein
MAGKAYYLTTLGEWRRQAHRFETSHFVRLDFVRVTGGTPERINAADAACPVLVLAEGDEGLHNELLGTSAWESLPHPLGNRGVSDRVAKALAGFGVREGATTFEVAEAAGNAHPLLRYQVF